MSVRMDSPLLERETALALALVLEEAGWPRVEAVSVFEERQAGSWRVAAYFDEVPAEDWLARLLALAGLEKGVLRPVALPALDWVAESQRRLAPVRAGRFFVHGAHDRRRAPPGGSIDIEIEAGQAFGTGHHGTTKGCLLALDWLLRRRMLTPGTTGWRMAGARRVLDVGTGSGVLAIAAARALKWPALASDIDAVAVRVAGENARKNEVAPLVRTLAAPGARHDLIRRHGPHGLVFANILARPLKGMADELRALLAPGGYLVLSGLLRAQETMVLPPYLERGLRLARRWRLEGWSTLLLERPRGLR